VDSKVGLRIMYCNSFPSGAGSLCFKGHYEIIVKNVAYEKSISIWTNHASWAAISAEFEESLPGKLEKWIAPASEGQHDFAVKYFVDGKEYWDNNNNLNYTAPQVKDGFSVITGKEFPIVHGASSLINSKLKVYAAVQNLGNDKEVGLVYTTDKWESFDTLKADYYWTMQSGIEVWLVEQNLSSNSDVEFALFYKVNDQQYWDNNFSRNYYLPAQSISAKKAGSANAKNEMWDAPSSAKVASAKTKKKIEPVAEKTAVESEALSAK
jgi:hypothetical protein